MASLTDVIAATAPAPLVETGVVTGVVALNMVTVNATGSDERAWCPMHLSPLPGDTVSIVRAPQGVLVVALLAAGIDATPPAPPLSVGDGTGLNVLATGAHTWLEPVGGMPLPNTWQAIGETPQVAATPGVAAIGSKIYVVGGQQTPTSGTVNPTANLYEYDTTTGTWTKRANLPAARWACGVAVIGTKLYVAGGYGPDWKATATLYEWDQASNTWATKAALPAVRGYAPVVAIGAKLYVVGGYSGDYDMGAPFYQSTSQTTLYEWTQSTNTWATKAPMLAAPYNTGATVVGSKIYVVQEDDDGYELLHSWDQSTNAWTALTASTNYDYWIWPWSMVAIDGNLYATDSDDGLYRWDVATGTVVPLATAPMLTYNSPAVAVGTNYYTVGVDYYHPGESIAFTSTQLMRWTRDGSPVNDQKYQFDWSRNWAQQGVVDDDRWIGQIAYPYAGIIRAVATAKVRLTLAGTGPAVSVRLAPTTQPFPQPDNGFGPAAPQPAAGAITVTLTPGQTEWVDLPVAWPRLMVAGGLIVDGTDLARIAGPDRDPQACMLQVEWAYL